MCSAPAHLQLDDAHKEFLFAAHEKAKWEIPEEENAILQIGLSAWEKQLAAQKSSKEKKRVQEKRRKLKGEVALKREILAKASSRKKKKAARRAEKKEAQRAAKAGDREADAVMA